MIISNSIRVFYILSLLFIWIDYGNAQDIEYARRTIDLFTSEAYGGRGYVGKADHLASAYISNQYDSLGLSSFGENYYQDFPISVNTLPGSALLKLNDKSMITGEDFHIDPGSPSLTGSFKTLYLRPNEILNPGILEGRIRKSKGRFIVIEDFDPSYYSVEQLRRIESNKQMLMYGANLPAEGVIEIVSDKLTWFSSPRQYERPVIRLSKSALKDEIELVEIDLESRFLSEYQTRNVIGFIEGQKSDSVVVISAHYDHLGKMGSSVYFPGANDNASGVALLLDIARHYSKEVPPYTLVFIAFSGEELGLRGSAWFVENPIFPLRRIKFLLNFDMAGTGDDGIQIVNGSVFQREFDLITQINADHQLLPQVRVRGEACNSDHCFFYRQGVPSFFIYTLGGIQAYHDIYDKGETLPLTNYKPYFELLVRFLDKL